MKQDNNRFEPLLDRGGNLTNNDRGSTNQSNKLSKKALNGADDLKDSTRFDSHKSRPQPGNKDLKNKHSSRGN